MDLVKVIIPIYKATFTQEERRSFVQAYQILGRYPLVVVKPESLDLSSLTAEYPKLFLESFPDFYFKGIAGYNQLMLSSFFYERFLNCDYILIYQLDAYVFRDELEEWCEKEYDYIGAPWLRRRLYQMPVLSGIMRMVRAYQHFRGKMSKQDLYDKIGNGGLSLRKVVSHYRVTQEQAKRINFYLSGKRHHLRNEDVFWATEPKGFIYPSPREAIRFSFDKYPKYCYHLNGQQLPFGCHAWYKRKMKSFWSHFITV